MGNNRKIQGQYIRVDFTTTAERKDWLMKIAAKQEISVSQLLNRLIRNRMKTEERFKKSPTEKTTEKEKTYPLITSETPAPKGCINDGTHIIKPDGSWMTTEELRNTYKEEEIDDEEDLPF